MDQASNCFQKTNKEMKRTSYFDFLRGIAILMVIAIHTFSACSFESYGGIMQITVRQLIGCPVPIFLAISAFFVGKKNLSDQAGKLLFWKRQIPKVYIPAIVWSLPLFALELIQGGNVFTGIIRLFLCGFSIYYFVVLIIQCYLLLPILLNIKYLQGGVITMAISMICIFLIAWFGMNRLPLLYYAGPVVTWILFFYTGLILCRFHREYSIKPWLFLLPITIVLMIVETYLLQQKGLSGFGIKPSVYLYSLVVILLLFSTKVQNAFNERICVNRLICYIGRISFAIYLIHCYFIVLLTKWSIATPWGIRWLCVTVCSVLLISITRKVFSGKILKYIGFQ